MDCAVKPQFEWQPGRCLWISISQSIALKILVCAQFKLYRTLDDTAAEILHSSNGQNCYTASCSYHSTQNVLGNGSTLRNVIRMKTDQPTMQYFKLLRRLLKTLQCDIVLFELHGPASGSAECKDSSEVPSHWHY